LSLIRDFLQRRPILSQFFALEVTEKYIHIPIQNKKKFTESTFRTVTLSETQGIKAAMAKYKRASKPWDRMHIQKYLFARSKGWTKTKAKAWVKKHKPKKTKRKRKR